MYFPFFFFLPILLINYIYKTSIKPYHYFTDALSFALPSTMKNPHTQLLGKTQDRSAMAGSDKGYQAGETQSRSMNGRWVLIPVFTRRRCTRAHSPWITQSYITVGRSTVCSAVEVSLQKFRWTFWETHRTEMVSSERWYLTGGIKVEFSVSIWKRLSIFVFSCWQPAHSKSHNNRPVYDSTHH